MTKTKPYNSKEGKKQQIITMFNNIATNYDILNFTLSAGLDNIWRKKAVKKLSNNPKKILDVATGTGDFAICASKYTKAKITGIDISNGMLDIANQKIKKKNLSKRIRFNEGDSEDMPFKDNEFDAVTVGFGVRNFENLEKGLNEIYRVLNKEGEIVILEPSFPTKKIFKTLYKLYFNFILPKIGALVSRDGAAYSYLPKSVATFPKNKEFIYLLKKIGFKKVKYIPLSFGIVSLFVAIK